MIQIRLCISSFDLQKHLTTTGMFSLEWPQVFEPWIAPSAKMIFIFLNISVIDTDTWLVLYDSLFAMLSVIHINLSKTSSVYDVW